jgi:hypothetical protein
MDLNIDFFYQRGMLLAARAGEPRMSSSGARLQWPTNSPLILAEKELCLRLHGGVDRRWLQLSR